MLKKVSALLLSLLITGGQAVNAAALGIKDINVNSGIKNVIVMVPDGMSDGAVSLSRWYKSYDANTKKADKTVTLAMDELVSGSVRTYWENFKGEPGAITDSAPAGTAMATGKKTHDKHVGVSPYDTKRPYATTLEAAESLGKSTGIIATSNIQHATPAAFSSHYFDRSRYDIIGEQQVYQGIDVLLGSGSMYLTEPYRKDGENLIDELKSMGYEYVTTKSEMDSVKDGKLWGMFAPDAMAYDMDRKIKTGTNADQPTLAGMTKKAIELLSKDEDGFFLLVEGSKVDWAAHANDPVGVISDVLAFDDAVKVALNFAKSRDDTMILYASDHGNGGITIGTTQTDSSYPSDPVTKFIEPLKKASITGEGIAAALNEERTNIKSVMSKFYGIDDLTDEEESAIKAADAASMNYTVGPIISKRANIGWTTTGHTGEDVTLYTYLPGNQRITGTINNTDIAQAVANAWGVNLNNLTLEFYTDANKAFSDKGAKTEVDKTYPDNPELKVTKGDTVIIIPENKNYVIINGKKVISPSVNIQTNDIFYVNKEIIALIK